MSIFTRGVCVHSKRVRWWTIPESVVAFLSCYKGYCTCVPLAWQRKWAQWKGQRTFKTVRPELIDQCISPHGGIQGNSSGRVDGWVDDGVVCRLTYIDKTDGPVTVSHGGPQALPSQHSWHTPICSEDTRWLFAWPFTLSCTGNKFHTEIRLKLHLILWTLELAKSSCGLLITTGNNSWICLICSPVSSIRVNTKLYYSLYEMYSSTVWLYYDVGGGIVCHNAPISLKMQFSSLLARNLTVNIKPKSLKMFGGGSSSVCVLARRLICVICFVSSSWMHSTPS